MSRTLLLPALDPDRLEPRIGSTYPTQFTGPVANRKRRRLGDALGLSHYGVNLVELPPGAWSAHRHWHTHEDEFVYVVRGELTLVTSGGEQVLGPGMTAGFPAGVEDGHHLVNKSDQTAVYLEVGDRVKADEVGYPDVDLALKHTEAGKVFTNKAGEPY